MGGFSTDFLWHVEEACANAHPSARELHLGGWLLRAAGGRARRTNSVNPLRAGPTDPSAIVEAAERVYADLGQPTIFRVPSLVPAMDAPLERRGYGLQAETCTLFAELSGPSLADGQGVDLLATPHGWYDAWMDVNDAPTEAVIRAYRGSVGALVLPRTFACLRFEGEPVAVAYGVLDRGLLVLESVATHARHRRRGHARKVIRSLLAWAQARGALGAALQVNADNAPARALYRSELFDQELYRYHYRRNDCATGP